MTELSRATSLLLEEKNILILGVGLTGLSCVHYLSAHNIPFSVNDSRDNVIDQAEFSLQYPNASLVLGDWHQGLISNADIILISPGIDLDATGIKAMLKADCQVWGDIELYCRLTKTPILAVTGSNGKSTVVSLLAHLGKTQGKNVQLGGNIGMPVLDHLIADDGQDIELLVLELSSFQLESLSSMQAIAATVLNVSDDHLDRHITLENYQKIKLNIYQQTQFSVINRDDSLSFESSVLNGSEVVSFGSDRPEPGHFGIETIEQTSYLMFGEQKLIAINELPLAGIHNALNCLAALALGFCAGWSLSGMVSGLRAFVGLAHRCQPVISPSDITWINDSKATNIGATLAAIHGLAQTMRAEQKLILIAGGDGKGADFSLLAEAIKQHVDQVITLGKDGDDIAVLASRSLKVTTLEQAVLTANDLAKADDIVLLSPACASIDMFSNFVARGQAFIQAVQQLPEVSAL